MECTERLRDDLDFIREFNRKSELLRIPVSGSIELTHRCNLRCIHCYLGSAASQRRDDEMSTSQVLTLIDEIAEAGCLYLLITGGEPLLRQDFPDIYTHAKKQGMVITVFTNATLLTDRIVDLFVEMPPRVVEVSLYGATLQTYEEVTRVPGSYEKCLDAVEKLVGKKVPVGLKTVLMTLNKDEFTGIQDIARSLGLKFRFDAAIFPCLDGDRTPLGLRVSPEEAVELEFADQERAKKWSDYFTRSKGMPANDNLYNCGAGLTSFHVDPYGWLQPCIMPTDLKYDLTRGGFQQGWRGTIAEIRSRKVENTDACSRCEKRHLCGFCPAFFKLESGEEQISSEYLCSIGSQRFLAIEKFSKQGECNVP